MDGASRRSGIEMRMIRLQPWKLWLLMAVAAGIALALTVAVAGLFLILVPMVLIGGFIAKLVLRSSLRAGQNVSKAGPDVIEGQYQVIEVDRRRR